MTLRKHEGRDESVIDKIIFARFNNRTITAAATLTNDDGEVLVNHSAAITVQLATARLRAGGWYRIIDISGNASANNVTIEGEGSQTINGPTVIDTNHGGVEYSTNGTAWFGRYL